MGLHFVCPPETGARMHLSSLGGAYLNVSVVPAGAMKVAFVADGCCSSSPSNGWCGSLLGHRRYHKSWCLFACIASSLGRCISRTLLCRFRGSWGSLSCCEMGRIERAEAVAEETSAAQGRIVIGKGVWLSVELIVGISQHRSGLRVRKDGGRKDASGRQVQVGKRRGQVGTWQLSFETTSQAGYLQGLYILAGNGAPAQVRKSSFLTARNSEAGTATRRSDSNDMPTRR
jgi:hypothetical protein